MTSDRLPERVAVDRDLLKIKDLVCRRERVLVEQEGADAHAQEMSRRVAELETAMRARKSKSATVFRRKKQMAYLIKQRGAVSATEASKALGISRNRANEYLKDMEKSGLLASKKRGRLVIYTSGGKA